MNKNINYVKKGKCGNVAGSKTLTYTGTIHGIEASRYRVSAVFRCFPLFSAENTVPRYLATIFPKIFRFARLRYISLGAELSVDFSTSFWSCVFATPEEVRFRVRSFSIYFSFFPQASCVPPPLSCIDRNVNYDNKIPQSGRVTTSPRSRY